MNQQHNIYRTVNDCSLTSSEDQQLLILQKAPLVSRVLASMIDHSIIAGVILIPFLFPFFGNSDRLDVLFLLAVFYILAIIIGYAFKDIIGGRSIGKRALGIAVRTKEDSQSIPSSLDLFLRNIFMILWPIDLLTLLSNTNKVKIGDRVAHSDVYLLSEKPKASVTILAFLGSHILAVIAYVVLLTGIVLAIGVNHPSFEVSVNYIEGSQEVIDIVGDIKSFRSSSFNINTSGFHSQRRGSAEHWIRVEGSQGRAIVRLDLILVPGENWEVTRSSVRQIR